MLELNNQIARLEIRAEQVLIHLQSLPANCRDAEDARHILFDMLMELRRCKEEREIRELAEKLDRAA
jgi:hypothetical protein